MGHYSSKIRRNRNRTVITNDDNTVVVKNDCNGRVNESTPRTLMTNCSPLGKTSTLVKWAQSAHVTNEDLQSAHTHKDSNNNLRPIEIPVRDVIPVSPLLPTIATSSTKSIALNFIKSKLSRVFNFRKTPITSKTEHDVNGNPMTRKKPGSQIAFSRPILQEIANVHNITVFQLTGETNATHLGDTPSKIHTPDQSSHLSNTPSKGHTAIKSLHLSDTPAITPGSLGDSSSTSSTSSSSTPLVQPSTTALIAHNKSHPTTASTIHSKPKTPIRILTPKARSNPTLHSKSRTPATKNSRAKKGCCHPIVAPPVYLDYGSSRGCGGGRNEGASSGNAILNRLKNVDVIEELQYHNVAAPGGDFGGNSDAEFDYYYQCNECGEMEPCKHSGVAEGGSRNDKPVTYSRRQRFNFAHGNNESEDGPPFSWPNSNACSCPCCRAGLRRNPDCQCKCCSNKGRARISNSFDEIPVGKNPEPKPCICDIEEEPKPDPEVQFENLLPKNSGVYFYDADQKRFVRQELRTPTPIVMENYCESELQKPQTPYDDAAPDLTEVIRAIPPMQKKKTVAPEPVVLPLIYGGCCDMDVIVANLEAAITAKGLVLASQPRNNQTKVNDSSNNSGQAVSGSTAYTKQSTKASETTKPNDSLKSNDSPNTKASTNSDTQKSVTTNESMSQYLISEVKGMQKKHSSSSGSSVSLLLSNDT